MARKAETEEAVALEAEDVRKAPLCPAKDENGVRCGAPVVKVLKLTAPAVVKCDACGKSQVWLPLK